MARPQRADLQPDAVPTEVEIAWAAGFWEGEGSVSFRGTFRVSAFQNERWTLDRLRRFFGGSVRPSQSGYCWAANARLALRFMAQVEPHLSPRRLDQYRKALADMEESRA